MGDVSDHGFSLGEPGLRQRQSFRRFDVPGGIIILVEINGLIGPGAATQKPLTTVSGTIHSGLALWLVLYVAGALINS